MLRFRSWLGLLAVVGGLMIAGSLTAHAQSIDYSALKYGTKQTSMASGYFVHPATVQVKHQAYVVTMDLKTAKKLTSWPVKVLSVDGHAPENVRKTKDQAGNSHLYYSFTTTNLKRRINARLAIDVPDVYKAKHKITFQFKTNHLPALRQATTSTTVAKQTNQASQSQATKPTTKTPAASSKATNSAQAKSSVASSSVASQSTRSAQSPAKHSATTQQAASQDQVPQQKTHWGTLVGGIVAILVLIGGGSWWYFGRH